MGNSRTPSRTRQAPPGARIGPERSVLLRSWRAIVALAVVVGVAAVGVVYVARMDSSEPQTTSDAPLVGSDLHAVAVIDGRRFVSGHEAAAYSDAVGAWEPISGLEGKDGMAWASVPGAILVGGHQGLYASTDGGKTFAPADANVLVTDVHALGAAGRTVYVASPAGGLFVSTDAGQTFEARSEAGTSFMGSMIVDPEDPRHVIAPDMAKGVVETRDGGETWQSLGGPAGAMSVAWDPRDHDSLVAVGIDGASTSTDAGRTWTPVEVPANTMATTLDSQGRMLAAALDRTTAEVYVSADGGNTWTPV